MRPYRKPAEVFDPRDFCWEEMTERHMEITVLPVVVRTWLAGERPMSPLVAQCLSALFGTSRDLWLNLDEAYRA